MLFTRAILSAYLAKQKRNFLLRGDKDEKNNALRDRFSSVAQK